MIINLGTYWDPEVEITLVESKSYEGWTVVGKSYQLSHTGRVHRFFEIEEGALDAFQQAVLTRVSIQAHDLRNAR